MSRHKGEQGLDSPLGETNEGGSPSLRDPEIVKVAHPSLQPGRRNRQLELGTTGQHREGTELRVDRLAAAFPQGPTDIL